MPTTSRQNRWVFGLGWIVANGFAWGIFYLLDILVRAAGGLTSSSFMLGFLPLARLDYFTGLWVGALVCAIIWGALVGLFQRLALRRRLKRKGAGWILVTMIGLLPLAVYLFLYQIFTSATSYPGDSFSRLNLLFILMEWIAPSWLAISQWLVLRSEKRYSYSPGAATGLAMTEKAESGSFGSALSAESSTLRSMGSAGMASDISSEAFVASVIFGPGEDAFFTW